MTAQPYFSHAPGAPAARPRRVGLIGVAVSTIGTLLLGGSMAIIWYANGRLDHVDLSDIVKAADDDRVKALPHAFFGWLLWVLWAVTLVVALVANLPGLMSTVLRVLAPVLGVLGVVLVYASLDQLIAGSGHVVDHASIGLWLAFVGFLVTGLGGAFGPRRG